MKCKYCFSEIPNNATFCKYCGSVLNSDSFNGHVQKVVGKNGQVAPVKKHRLRKFLLFLVFSFLILSLVAYTLIFIFFPSNRYYVSEYVSELDGVETVESKNHRGFTTKKVVDGETTMEVKFDDDGRISDFIYADGENTVNLRVVNYKSTSDGYEGVATHQSIDYNLVLVYNKRNKLISFSFVNNDGKIPVFASMEYNELGIMTKAEITNKEIFELRKYDYKGDLLLEENYINDVLVASYEYENGVMRKSSVALKQEVTAKSVAIKEYENATYSEKGIVETCEIYDENNDIISYWTVESEDSTTVIQLKKEQGSNEILERRIYSLNSDGNITTVQYTDAEGEQISKIAYSYDRDGNTQSIIVYDENNEKGLSTTFTWKKIPLFIFGQ